MSLSPLPRGRWDAAFMLATWFGCGFAPKGPGTAGSLAALMIAILIHAIYGSGRVTFLVLAALLAVPGIWAAGVVAEARAT